MWIISSILFNVKSVAIMGYPVCQFVTNVDENLQCGVCSGVLEEATLTPCGHSFCAACLKTWLDREPQVDEGGSDHSASSSQTCPACRGSCQLSDLTPIHSIRSLILAMAVFCPYRSEGCSKTMRLDQQEDHVPSCPHALVPCPACGSSVPRQELSVHQLGCDFILGLYVEDARSDADRKKMRIEKGATDRISSMTLQIKKMKAELIQVEQRNSELQVELTVAHKELLEKHQRIQQIQHVFFDPDYEYGYAGSTVARLSGLISRFLHNKPDFVDTARIFQAIKRCYDNYGRSSTIYEDDVQMLLSTANASSWFSDGQKLSMRVWLMSLARYQQCTHWASTKKSQTSL